MTDPPILLAGAGDEKGTDNKRIPRLSPGKRTGDRGIFLLV